MMKNFILFYYTSLIELIVIVVYKCALAEIFGRKKTFYFIDLIKWNQGSAELHAMRCVEKLKQDK